MSFVDCTATAVIFEDEIRAKTVFEPDQIVIQTVFTPLLTYSAAIIAYVEANFETDKEKNELCRAVPLADTPAEWITSTLGNMMNSFTWSQNKELNRWTNKCRLNPNAAAAREAREQEPNPAHAEMISKIRNATLPAVMNAQKILAEAQSG